MDRYGKAKVNAAVEINVRWEQGINFAQVPETTKQQITATIYVDQQIPLGSILWKGTLANLPASPTGLVQVLDYGGVPDVKGRYVRRLVHVGKYNDTLPEVA